MNKRNIFFIMLFIVVVVVSCMPLSKSIDEDIINPIDTVTPTKTLQETIPYTVTPVVQSTMTATVYGSLMPPTPDASMQTYVDPEGWYQVQFPVDLLFDQETNRYKNRYRYFESGYLAEYGTMSRGINVCAWIVNVEEKEPENYYINWIPNSDEVCSISTKSNQSRQTRLAIYENPVADAAHRFIFTEIGWSSSEGSPDNGFRIQFDWLQPMTDVAFVNHEISYEEKPDGWEDIGPELPILSINEYPLMPGMSPYGDMLLQMIPEEAKPDWAKEGYVSTKTEEPPVKELTLEDLGYELRDGTYLMDGREIPGQRLYRDDRLLLDAVWDISKIYLVDNDSQPYPVFIVKAWRTMTTTEEAYIIQNDAIRSWPSSIQDPYRGALVLQDSMLWLKINEDHGQVEVVKTNPQSIETIYSFTIFTEGLLASDQFTTWDEHWVWANKDFLIQDGLILNNEIGVQEIFSWRIIEEQPVFIFRKDGRVGFYANGKFAALPYQDVVRHMCCGLMGNNPSYSSHELRFFGVRDGAWYYVVVAY